MRRTVIAVSATIIALSISACASATDSTPAVAAPRYSPDEQAALTSLHGACREDDDKLYAEAKKANELMIDSGVRDETTLSVLQHLRQSIPQDSPVMGCSEVLATYVTVRAHGGG
ncbi:hypothetical protein [Nocardia terpenica]|uniref:Lipoprotein n=1 Tax=Nocardia terpenica TaxID=455432 RepID=A0A164JUY6_9NOCA|nr:hypothetical protein [Nocardia terpenica]KZM70746.1 hypothetical protein AWN90_40005 [Nocardia terpenica]NQE89988.1 hypothetical protein [Nocardia terpenica]